jgi:hypothetical protein
VAPADRQLAFRVARGILATAVLLLGSATYYMWQKYTATAPSFTDQVTGETHTLNANGLTVYLTRQEQFVLYGLAVSTAACLAGAVALDAFAPKKEESE